MRWLDSCNDAISGINYVQLLFSTLISSACAWFIATVELSAVYAPNASWSAFPRRASLSSLNIVPAWIVLLSLQSLPLQRRMKIQWRIKMESSSLIYIYIGLVSGLLTSLHLTNNYSHRIHPWTRPLAQGTITNISKSYARFPSEYICDRSSVFSKTTVSSNASLPRRFLG